jgi:hypothetical protein
MGDAQLLPRHLNSEGVVGSGRAYRGLDSADDGDLFGFEKKPKYKQSKKKMKWGMERAPLISGVKTRFVPKSGTGTFAK